MRGSKGYWKDQIRALATNGGKGSIQPINKRIHQQN